MNVMIDTRKLMKDFESHGFSEQQADMLTTALADRESAYFDKLATKDDLKLLEQSLQKDLVNFEQSLQKDLVGMEERLKSHSEILVKDFRENILKWVIGIVGLQGIGILAAAAILNKFLK
jgi:hypothetical protein